jgi:hypothetical protein
MAVFGQCITVTPVASQPGAPAYQARGSYSSKQVDVPLEDGTYHSTIQRKLGVMLADFAVAPMQNDEISMAQGSFVIADIVPDGQGGADIWLRNVGTP